MMSNMAKSLVFNVMGTLIILFAVREVMSLLDSVVLVIGIQSAVLGGVYYGRDLNKS